jgi:hypothetical protein
LTPRAGKTALFFRDKIEGTAKPPARCARKGILVPMEMWPNRSLCKLIAALCLACGFCAAAPGQGSSQQSQPAETKAAPPPSKEPLTPEEKKRAELRADTEKLYQLTQELKAEVAKSSKDTLSVPVVKKAQEIERLAKSIKERSRNQ